MLHSSSPFPPRCPLLLQHHQIGVSSPYSRLQKQPHWPVYKHTLGSSHDSFCNSTLWTSCQYSASLSLLFTCVTHNIQQETIRVKAVIIISYKRTLGLIATHFMTQTPAKHLHYYHQHQDWSLFRQFCQMWHWGKRTRKMLNHKLMSCRLCLYQEDT